MLSAANQSITSRRRYRICSKKLKNIKKYDSNKKRFYLLNKKNVTNNMKWNQMKLR